MLYCTDKVLCNVPYSVKYNPSTQISQSGHFPSKLWLSIRIWPLNKYFQLFVWYFLSVNAFKIK